MHGVLYYPGTLFEDRDQALMGVEVEWAVLAQRGLHDRPGQVQDATDRVTEGRQEGPAPIRIDRKPTMPTIRKTTPPTPPAPPAPAAAADRLLGDVRALIEAAREQTARAVNSALVGLYWHIGTRIRQDVLQEKRAEYGEEIVATLSRQLTAEYGRGYDRRNLYHMIRFAEVFPDEAIVNALRTQLSWTHFRELLAIDDPLKREFYAEMCRAERWSYRTLRHKIAYFLFERTAVSKKPDEVIARDMAALRDEDRMTPDLVFRDPYLLDFLGLTGTYSEAELEQAIIRELEAFILELGRDFAFVARQQRITVDYEDYYLDLLFYHRRLRRLVAIDLKIGRFQAADKGQMELYLRWLEKYDTRPGEEPPLGLILCADKFEDHVELLQLDKSGIRVAQYLTELPPRELLEKTLHESVRRARERLAIERQDAPAAPHTGGPTQALPKRKTKKKPKG
jgi:predicted nuclease of restriction endonuclease-like (RecB) superfamily